MTQRSPDELTLEIAEALATTGWCQVPNFLPPAETRTLAAECNAMWDEGLFREARVGSGAGLERRPEIRGDHVLWLDPTQPTAAQAPFYARMELLRQTLNRALFLGLVEMESHFARYPAGSFYKRHNDRHKGSALRTVTGVFYLNEEWQPGDGGQLRVFLPDGGHADVLPEAGTLACFVTADYEHEVLPARRERMSVTNWYRVRG